MTNKHPPRAKVTITLSDHLLTQGKILAIQKKMSFSAIAEEALAQYLQDQQASFPSNQ